MSARVFVLVAVLAALSGPDARALGITRSPESVALGATLNFAVTVQLATDEALTSTCVTADVQQGEQRVPPSTLRVAVEPGSTSEERLVRVLSTGAIDEPVVTIILTLGCGNKLERRFTVLADPPLVTVAAAPLATPAAEPAAQTERPIIAAPAAPAASAPHDLAAAPTSNGAAARSDTTTTPRSDTTPRTETTVSTPPAAASRVAAALRPPASAAAARRPARPVTSLTTSTVAVAAPAAVPPRAAASTAAPLQGPRLKLDALEPTPRGVAVAASASALQDSQEAQLRVAAMAASAAVAEQAASVALSNMDAAAERMRAIEEGVAKLKVDIERDREQMVALRTKLARAESTSRLAPWLGVGMALLAALALGLWLRMRKMQQEQQARWWAASRAAQNSKLPPTGPPTLHPMTLPPHMVPTSTQPQVAPTPTPAPAAKPTLPAATGFRDSLFTSNQQPRDVSIEELIDLEQQAEFFVVLGQDDSAIDLLMGHIRSSGGTSPLPYLKLLEIYRRLGDRATYERTRERFNHRFNAYAPDWDSDLQQGRSLDEYPNIMKRLEATWRTPLDAMAELEALMFRRDGGELFELPAYREVLFLYSMARDLIDHEGGPPPAIDVLLPLSEPANDFEPTTARPHLFTSVGALGEAALPGEPPIEVLRASGAVPAAGEEATSVYGVVDLDPTNPVPMDDTVVFRHDGDQRSDFAELPPPKPKS